jgi:condensin complex subunit 2
VDNDGSFTADGARVPLKKVNINDDAAEKRRRRKSTKITVIDTALGGPSSEGTLDQDGEHARGSKQKQPLNTLAPPVLNNVSLDVMSSNFEEWMKMATDNVRFSFIFIFNPSSLTYIPENQCPKFVEFCSYRLFP